MKKGTAAAIGGAVALIVGGAAYVFAQQQVKPPPPNLAALQLSATTPTTISATGQVTFQLTATDTSGMPLAGVSAPLDPTGVNVGPTDSTGKATSAPINFPLPGTYTITAVAGRIVSNGVTITVNPLLNALSLTPQSTSVIQGQSDTYTVAATDQSGSPLPGVIAQLIDSVSGNAVGVFPVTGTGGMASLPVVFGSTGSFTYFAQAPNGLGGTVQTANVTVTVKAPPVLTTIQLSVSKSKVNDGSTVTFTVLAVDQYGSAIQGITPSLNDFASGTLLLTFAATSSFGTTTATYTFSTNVTSPTVYQFQAFVASLLSNVVPVTVNPPVNPIGAAGGPGISGTVAAGNVTYKQFWHSTVAESAVLIHVTLINPTTGLAVDVEELTGAFPVAGAQTSISMKLFQGTYAPGTPGTYTLQEWATDITNTVRLSVLYQFTVTVH